MKKNLVKTLTSGLLVTGLLAASLTGCGSSDKADSSADGSAVEAGESAAGFRTLEEIKESGTINKIGRAHV